MPWLRSHRLFDTYEMVVLVNVSTLRGAHVASKHCPHVCGLIPAAAEVQRLNREQHDTGVTSLRWSTRTLLKNSNLEDANLEH
jgi:hypothetical protein